MTLCSLYNVVLEKLCLNMIAICLKSSSRFQINTLRLEQYGRHFVDDFSKALFFMLLFAFCLQFLLQFVGVQLKISHHWQQSMVTSSVRSNGVTGPQHIIPNYIRIISWSLSIEMYVYMPCGNDVYDAHDIRSWRPSRGNQLILFIPPIRQSQIINQLSILFSYMRLAIEVKFWACNSIS